MFNGRMTTLTRAILALPDGLRSAVTLRYFQGFSIEETASILKLSRRTIHYRLEKAEHLLKDHLEGWYDALMKRNCRKGSPAGSPACVPTSFGAGAYWRRFITRHACLLSGGFPPRWCAC